MDAEDRIKDKGGWRTEETAQSCDPHRPFVEVKDIKAN